MPGSSPRTAYIRTTDDPDKPYDQIYQFLSHFVRQKYPEEVLDGSRHRFLFGASNAQDAHILDIFLSDHIVPSRYQYGEFANLLRSDLELRVSEAHAATGAGQRVLQRCNAGGIRVVISGVTDLECHENMLQDCDYVIDDSAWGYQEWFWKTARIGVPQDSLLTNPSFDMSQHDASKTRLSRRYAGHGWKANSGCSHGNGGFWRCHGCGGKCKRGRCRINPPQESPAPEYLRLPDKGSAEWRAISANEACMRMRQQRVPGRFDGMDVYSSTDTFSGD
jgi:hypothetical protein